MNRALSELNKLNAIEAAKQEQILKAQNLSLTKQITEFTANLPSKWLKKRAKTPDQVDEWHRLNAEATGLGECIHARFTGLNDPLEKFLEAKEMTLQEHSYAFFLVDKYEILWGVIQLGEKYIKKFLKDKYPFKLYREYSACALYLEILKEEKDNIYRLCLEYQYLHVSVTGLKEASKFVHEALGPRQLRFNDEMNGWVWDFDPSSSRADKNKMQKFRGVTTQYPELESLTPWLVKSLQICRDASKRDDALRAKVTDYYQALSRVAEMEVKLLDNRHSSRTQNKQGSYAWINGQRVFDSLARREPRYVTKT